MTYGVDVDGPFVLISNGMWEVCIQAGCIINISIEPDPCDISGTRVTIWSPNSQVVDVKFGDRDRAFMFAARVRRKALEAGQWRRG